MANPSEKDKPVVVTNLALAAMLTLEGYDSELTEVEGSEARDGRQQGAWVFERTPELLDLVDDFNDGEARVEPSAFHSKLNASRRQMFAFLGR